MFILNLYVKMKLYNYFLLRNQSKVTIYPGFCWILTDNLCKKYCISTLLKVAHTCF